MTGSFNYKASVNIEIITILGVKRKLYGGGDTEYNSKNKKLVLHVDVPLAGKYKKRIL